MDDLSLLTDALPSFMPSPFGDIPIDTRWHVQIDVQDHLEDTSIPEAVRLDYFRSRIIKADCPASAIPVLVASWQVWASASDERLDAGRARPKKGKVFDFWNDARLIIAGFQQAYSINLLESDMHWYRFLCLLEGLPSSTKFAERLETRARENQKGNAEYNRALQSSKAQVRLVNRYTSDRSGMFQKALDALDL